MYAKHEMLGWRRLGQDESGEEVQLFRKTVLNRRLVGTEKGYLGLVASGAQNGDRVAVVRGCRVPVVLRQVEEHREWQFVGDGYIYGMMHGKGFNLSNCRTLRIA